jgi:hypothetical protein
MKIKIILTFDYELPLGGVKSYQKGLFEPSSNIINLADKLNIPIVLFADICSAIKFKEWDLNFFEQFKTQIQSAIKDKHDVQLHIHPHWMDSKFENNQFLPSPKFGLSNFKDDPNYSIEDIIKLSFETLYQICSEVDKEYNCVAFRAGGYNIEPESKIILNILYQLGIRIESSVIQGLYHNHSFSKIDYRNSPKKNKWSISINGPLIIEKESDFIEYPISSMPNSILNIIERRLKKTLYKDKIKARKYDNTGRGFSEISKNSGWLDKMKMAMNPIVLTFDRDFITLLDLERIVDYNVKKYFSEEEIILTLISHPKSMGEYHLKLMHDFVLLMKNKFKDDLSFITYQSLLKR